MHESFRDIPQEVRQQAFDLFVSLPVYQQYTGTRLKQDAMSVSGECLCPWGAVLFTLCGETDCYCAGLPEDGMDVADELVWLADNGSEAAGQIFDFLDVDKVDDFINKFEVGAYRDPQALAEAMGVSINTQLPLTGVPRPTTFRPLYPQTEAIDG